MSVINTEIKMQGNDDAWFTTNASVIFPDNIQIFHNDGRYKFTDGVTALSALPFLGSSDLATVLGVGNTTGEQRIESDNGLNYLDLFNLHTEIGYTVGGGNGGFLYIDDATLEANHESGISLNSPNINFPQETASRIAVLDASKNLKSGTVNESDLEVKSNKGTVLGNLTSTTIYTHAKAVVDYVASFGYITNVITALGYIPANKAGDTFTGAISATNLSGTNTGDETLSTLGTKINDATGATPNDTDLVATVDSSLVKKITWTNIKVFLKTYFDTLYGNIKGSVGATAGLIPYGTGVADTVTSSSNFSYISDNVQVTGNVNGTVTMTTRNNSTGNGAGTGFNAVNNAGKIAQFFKAGTGYSTYKTIKANDCGFYTDNGDFSFLNDGVGGEIQFTAGNASIAHLLIKSNGDVATAKNSFFGDTATTATAYGDFKAGTTSNASMRIRAGVLPTTQLDGEINYVGGRLKHYNGTDNTIAYVSEIQELALINALIFG